MWSLISQFGLDGGFLKSQQYNQIRSIRFFQISWQQYCLKSPKFPSALTLLISNILFLWTLNIVSYLWLWIIRLYLFLITTVAKITVLCFHFLNHYEIESHLLKVFCGNLSNSLNPSLLCILSEIWFSIPIYTTTVFHCIFWRM